MNYNDTIDRVFTEILPALIAEAKATKTEIKRHGLRITKGGGVYHAEQGRKLDKSSAAGIIAFALRPATGWSR